MTAAETPVGEQHPARWLDHVVKRLGNDRQRATDQARSGLLDDLAQSVYSVLGLTDRFSDITFRALFHRGRFPKNHRRVVVAALLRAIAADRDCIPQDMQAKFAIPLFDEELGQVYRRLDLTEKTENYRKWSELVGVAHDAERRLAAAVSDIASLSDIRRFQADLMRSVKEPAVSAVVIPLLPEDLVGPALRDVMNALASCLALTGADGYERYEQANTLIQDFRARGLAVNSAYADEFVVAFADRLGQLLQAEAQGSGLLEPASVSLLATTKRYPLHVPEQEITLRWDLVNQGVGTAFGVRLDLEDAEELLLAESVLFFGDLPPGARRVQAQAIVASACVQGELEGFLSWSDADGTEHEDVVLLPVRSQTPDVDWNLLDPLRAYPQRAVQDDTRLAGRNALMDELEAAATGAEVASFRISGQKRIGKSSLVRSLQTRLSRRPGGPVTAYIDVNKLMGGEDADEALRKLMRKVSLELSRTAGCDGEVEVPNYESDFSAFNDFVEALREWTSGRSFLVILDEFDELPNGAFARGGPGDALFRGLKAFSSDGDCGFFLVGGERLDLALAAQNDRLNGFAERRVGFLGEDNRRDFDELVQGPVSGLLTFDREALDAVWDCTGGHPFYTFMICREIVGQARADHDAHITQREVEQAYERAVDAAPANAFAHIWMDGVFADGEEVTVISERRVRVLLSWARAHREGGAPTEDQIVSAGESIGLAGAEIREELRSFVRRRVFRMAADRYEATSRYFGDWLRDRGAEKIRAGQPTLEAVARQAERESRDRVRAEEIVELVQGWGTYQAQPITTVLVSCWIEQFGEPARQRLALRLLQGVRLVSMREIREAFIEIHRTARRQVKVDLDLRASRKQVASRDFAVVFIEPEGKSGVTLASAYASANKIIKDCVSHVDRAHRLLERHSIQRVVIVDDLLATGGTACRRLREHRDAIAELIDATGKEAVFAVYAAFESAVVRVQETAEELGLSLIVQAHELLDESDRCFSEASGHFVGDDEGRLEARLLVEQIGRDLGSKEPLGTGDCQMLLVFEHNCPNNSLPVLWKSGGAISWTPIFPRARAA